MRQLLALHKQEEAEALLEGGAAPATRPNTVESEADGQQAVPLYIARALPGLRAQEFSRMKHQSLFLLSSAYVCEAASVLLLKLALEVRPLAALHCCVSLWSPAFCLPAVVHLPAAQHHFVLCCLQQSV